MVEHSIPVAEGQQEIPQAEGQQEIAQAEAVQEIPQAEAVQEIPQAEAVQEIPQAEAVQEIPQAEAVQEIPQAEAVQKRKHRHSNITVLDLSGIPFEVLNITVALVSRLIFSFAYNWKKWRDDKDMLGNIENPFLMVYEEAHNYIPKNEESKYKSVREAVERIAKEGRKYGLSAMIVSQRPSEISETIRLVMILCG